MDRCHLLKTLEGYGAGPHMRGLLEEFCKRQEVVIRKNGYHGTHFQETRGTTQGGHIYPTLFNLILDNVVHNWLVLTVEDDLVAHEGPGLAVRRYLGLFYANNGMVGLWDPEWPQGNLSVIIGLFRRYGPVAIVFKYKAMKCQTGAIQSGMSEETVGRRCTGRGGGRVQRVNKKANPLTRLRSETHNRIDDCDLIAHAWDRTIDRLEPVTGQHRWELPGNYPYFEKIR